MLVFCRISWLNLRGMSFILHMWDWWLCHLSSRQTNVNQGICCSDRCRWHQSFRLQYVRAICLSDWCLCHLSFRLMPVPSVFQTDAGAICLSDWCLCHLSVRLMPVPPIFQTDVCTIFCLQTGFSSSCLLDSCLCHQSFRLMSVTYVFQSQTNSSAIRLLSKPMSAASLCHDPVRARRPNNYS